MFHGFSAGPVKFVDTIGFDSGQFMLTYQTLHMSDPDSFQKDEPAQQQLIISMLLSCNPVL